MQFLFPTFLWALLALAIPIIIHLFHFRRFKKVYFTNVHLLKEIKEETSAKSRLKSLLVLLSRLLALAMLVFAFAQPIISHNQIENKGPKVVSVFVDNSFSMQAAKDQVALLVRAKDQAMEIIKSYKESDEYVVLTHDLEAKHQRVVDQKTALNFISEINVTPEVHQLEDIVNVSTRITDRDADQEKLIYLLSDFQNNISSFENAIDTTLQVNLVPIQSLQENNIAITDAYFEAPVAMNNVTNPLIVEFQNNGDRSQDIQFRMMYKGQNRPQGIVQIPANSSVTDTIQLAISETGWHDIELIIEDYPIQFDDKLFLSFEIKQKVSILNIYDDRPNRYLESAFSSIDYYELNQYNKSNIQYNNFNAQDLIILDDLTQLSSGLTAELNKYVNNGGNLLIFPSAKANVDSYNQLLGVLNADRLGSFKEEEAIVSDINTREFTFNDVYETRKRNLRLPTIQSSYTLLKNQRADKDWLLRFRNGENFLTKSKSDKGNVYLSVAPLDEKQNNLVVNAEVFIPMLYKMALSSGVKKPLYYTIGKDDLIEFKRLETLESGNYTITGIEEFIPSVIQDNNSSMLDIRDQVSKAGTYALQLKDQVISKLAFNYDRIESDVRHGDMDLIVQSMGGNVAVLGDVAMADLSNYINEKNNGISLWRWCLILALLFLLIETALLRFWK